MKQGEEDVARIKRNEYQRLWRLKNIEKARAIDRARSPGRFEQQRQYRRSRLEHCNARSKAWRDANPDKVSAYYKTRMDKYDPEKRRAQGLRELYGLSMDAYYAMLASQGGCCALCGVPFGSTRATAPHVDHDHATGANRGILHAQCNVGLGSFRDDPGLCEQAAAYLRSHLGTTSP